MMVPQLVSAHGNGVVTADATTDRSAVGTIDGAAVGYRAGTADDTAN